MTYGTGSCQGTAGHDFITVGGMQATRFPPQLANPIEQFLFANVCDFLAGSFSGVSKPTFATNCAFCSIFEVLHDLHTFPLLQYFSKTSAQKN
jgi:hypothetical protein